MKRWTKLLLIALVGAPVVAAGFPGSNASLGFVLVHDWLSGGKSWAIIDTYSGVIHEVERRNLTFGQCKDQLERHRKRLADWSAKNPGKNAGTEAVLTWWSCGYRCRVAYEVQLDRCWYRTDLVAGRDPG